MKIILDNIEVEIKVKKVGATKTSVEDTVKFINELMMVYSDSATFSKTQGYDFLYDKRMNRAIEIYAQLRKEGKLPEI